VITRVLILLLGVKSKITRILILLLGAKSKISGVLILLWGLISLQKFIVTNQLPRHWRLPLARGKTRPHQEKSQHRQWKWEITGYRLPVAVV
jgi:hypothetical protein